MKALLIAEDENAISKITNVLKSCSYDVITYRWLLKALDNVEEIAPDLAIVSTTEYPRHWKTFAQFTESGIGGSVPNIILYNSHPLSSEDEKKAKELNVLGSFTSIDDEGLKTLKGILLNGKDSFEEPVIEEPIQEESLPTVEKLQENNIDTSSENEIISKTQKISALIFTNPKNGAFISGQVISQKDFVVTFKPDLIELTLSLTKGILIDDVTAKVDNKFIFTTAKIIKADKDIVLEIKGKNE